MSVLVVNTGSTSVKYKLFDRDATELVGGTIQAEAERCVWRARRGGSESTRRLPRREFDSASRLIVEESQGHAAERVGFRVVHGGESFTAPTRITDAVMARLDELGRLAPLHNPPALATIREFRELLPDTPLYAVFDTAFHASLPPQAYLYAIPYELYERHGIRKYGFHGISHQYVSARLTELEGNAGRQIVCHLGGGASITAVDRGASIETSMGFTPLAGLTMATRSGDLDVGVIFHLVEDLGFSLEQVRRVLNERSGLLGLSRQSADMRSLLDKEREGDARAALAIAVYVHHIQRYVGGYAAVLGGLDVLAFTAGVGAGSATIRERVCTTLGYLGIEIDASANLDACDPDRSVKISAPSSVPVWVVPTDEELQIFREVSSLRD